MEISISKYIDYTLLRPVATLEMYQRLCEEASANGYYSVCVPPFMVSKCGEYLKDTDVKITTVISFPLGYSDTQSKAAEIKNAVHNGADEIDAVMNISAFISGETEYTKNEFKVLRQACAGKVLKIIIETCYLTNEQIAQAAVIAAETGADFVKTSTGYGTRGASLEDIRIIKQSVPGNVKIKASGGIKTYEQAVQFIEAGADRIGTSSALNKADREINR